MSTSRVGRNKVSYDGLDGGSDRNESDEDWELTKGGESAEDGEAIDVDADEDEIELLEGGLAASAVLANENDHRRGDGRLPQVPP